MTIPAPDPLYTPVSTAHQLRAGRLVTGVSPVLTAQELARRIGVAWERLPEPRRAFVLEVSLATEEPLTALLGPAHTEPWQVISATPR